MGWVAHCKLFVGYQFTTVFALPMHSSASIALCSLKEVLVKVKHCRLVTLSFAAGHQRGISRAWRRGKFKGSKYKTFTLGAYLW